MATKTLDEVLMPVYDKYYKAWQKLVSEGKSERDIRAKHFELIVGDLAEHINIIKCVNLLGNKYPKDMEEVTGYNKEKTQLLLENYGGVVLGDIFFKFIIRTELLFRSLYGELNPGTDVSMARMPQIIGAMTGDTPQNWQKEESKLLVMLWDARNSIHMSGIYSKASKTHTYKGQSFSFDKEMRGIPFSVDELIYIMQEACDVVEGIVRSATIAALPDKDHPFYKVFGK
jgi:hypothetical protein